MESGVRGQESGVSSQYAGVRGQKLEFRVGGLGVGGGAKVRARGFGVSAEGSPILLTHYINFSDLLKHSAFSASLRLCVKKTSSPAD